MAHDAKVGAPQRGVTEILTEADAVLAQCENVAVAMADALGGGEPRDDCPDPPLGGVEALALSCEGRANALRCHLENLRARL